MLTWAVSCGILCVKEMGAVPDVRYALEDLHFVWDSDKEALNIKKHGLSFKTAAMVFLDALRLDFPDRLHSTFNESRYFTIGLVSDVLTVVYCERGDINDPEYRLISAREASPAERRAYNDAVFGRR